jgi:dTMP kinase
MISLPDPGRGVLVVIEGIDGSGKTTQVGKVESFLRSCGRSATRFKEPTDGPFGRRIARILTNGREVERVTPQEEMNLFLHDRRENVKNTIVPALTQNRIALGDRYYFLSICYQGSLEGNDPVEVRRLNELVAPIPDLTVVLVVPPEEGVRRITEQRGQRPNKFEDLTYLRQVAAEFDKVDGFNLVKVDATLSIDSVFEEVCTAVSNTLSSMCDGTYTTRLAEAIKQSASMGRDTTALARKFVHEVYLGTGGTSFEWRCGDRECGYHYDDTGLLLEALNGWTDDFASCGVTIADYVNTDVV